MEQSRLSDVQAGVRVEVMTVGWMVIEMAVSIAAGIAAGSVLLIAFGIDSLIELVSGGMLLWRLMVEAHGGQPQKVERAEHLSKWVVSVSLALLSVYVLASALYGLISGTRPDTSIAGIAVSAAALVLMPYLARLKLRIATRIGSDALSGDAVNSITCAYMAATVLLGLALNGLFGWWWADDLAALLFLFWLVREMLESFREARQNHAQGITE